MRRYSAAIQTLGTDSIALNTTVIDPSSPPQSVQYTIGLSPYPAFFDELEVLPA